MKPIRQISIFFLSLFFGTFSFGAAAPQVDIVYREPPHAANPFPDNEVTRVRMVAEQVVIDIKSTSPEDPGYARVTETFQFRNLGESQEKMHIRLPLSLFGKGDDWRNCKKSYYPSIGDTNAWVNGNQIAIRNTYLTLNNPWGDYGVPFQTRVACWAHLPGVFPTGKDVTVRVAYTVRGFARDGAWVQYPFLLQPGAGWQSAIGSVDLVFRLPYEANEMNVVDCSGCLWDGDELRWHAENFEPRTAVTATILNPALWLRITNETKITREHPNNGDAWGRLGKAYKQAIWQPQGLRDSPTGEEMYRLSQAAYQQSVSLFPRNADWRFGYAELLCWRAVWDDPTQMETCLEQLDMILEINPKHTKTLNFMRQYLPAELASPRGKP